MFNEKYKDIKEFESLDKKEQFGVDFKIGLEFLEKEEEGAREKALTALAKHLIEKGFIREIKQKGWIDPFEESIGLPPDVMDFRYDIMLQHKVKG